MSCDYVLVLDGHMIHVLPQPTLPFSWVMGSLKSGSVSDA